MRYLLILLLMTACTPFNPGPIPKEVMDCPDEACVIDLIQSVPHDQFESGQELFGFMECQEPVDLHEMLANGRLIIERKSWLLATGALGYIHWTAGSIGGMKKCEIAYVGYHALAHELWHCRGRGEAKPYLWFPNYGYTPGQKEIMRLEGVSNWCDTSYNK